MESLPTPFCVGHHETKRPLPVTAQTIQQAHEANYDMVTSAITTPYFHSRILALLSSALAQSSQDAAGRSTTPIVIPPLTPPDTPLSPEQSMSQIIATTSPWIDVCSPDPLISDLSRQILKLEITYAAFCGITYVLVPGPRLRRHDLHGSGLFQYARAVLDALSHGPYMQFHIWLPMIDTAGNEDEKMGDLAIYTRHAYQPKDEDEPERLDLFGTWEAWDSIRAMCKYHSRLCVALSIPNLLPPVPIQSRWHSEPVRLFTWHASIFARNAKGYPVLSKAHQALISRFMRLRTPPWFLLCDVGPLPDLMSSPAATSNAPSPMDATHYPPLGESHASELKDPTPHLSYLRNLQGKQPPQTQIEKFGSGYQDYLQAPLQPLTVNLESITYEVFEKDPIKYDWYEKAMARALHDWIEQGKPASGTDGRIVVAVVGAGRGPLVTRALQASLGVGVEIDMWALEKNPNAFILLQRHNATIWNERVHLVQSDMRSWRGPVRQPDQTAPSGTAISSGHATTAEPYTGDAQVDHDWLLASAATAQTSYKVDILVSELLGSFADNELSPECLDGVQHLLNPVHGISIPASYSAHITPIAAPKLYTDICNQSIANPNAPEIPFVVMLHAIDYLSTYSPTTAPDLSPAAPPHPLIQRAWTFHHPNSSLPSPSGRGSPPNSNAHNTRHSTLSFSVPHRATCHGIAGYFEAVLYRPTIGPAVELSTNPATMDAKSASMISWFPIYFPLRSPVFVPDEGELVVHMWRRTDGAKVWYEWVVDVYGAEVEGEDGQMKRRMRVGRSELHSSIKEACLM